MIKLTLQIHESQQGWLDAAELLFHSNRDVSIEYDLDYGCRYLQNKSCFAFSVLFPVEIGPYRGPIPGYLIDLIPQGYALKRLLSRYGIRSEEDYSAILGLVPLASPGNLRIKEPWFEIECHRPAYEHAGFSLEDIVQAKENFIEYMEAHGAPAGGTSGAAGGAPKFLLRQDYHGRFHADGYLDDDKTKQAYLIKFPFTDSSNSRLLTRTEKAYYDLLRQFPLKSGAPLEIYDDILFIPRFDRIRKDDGRLHYYGLESFYSAHGMNTYGHRLTHEQNLQLIKQHSSDWENDAVEYIARDLVNRALSNPDNHGRNTSLIKIDSLITLSPIYDVTAMKFFKGDFVVPLSYWQQSSLTMTQRLEWLDKNLSLSPELLHAKLCTLRDRYLLSLEDRLHEHHVSEEVIEWSGDDRRRVLRELAEL